MARNSTAKAAAPSLKPPPPPPYVDASPAATRLSEVRAALHDTRRHISALAANGKRLEAQLDDTRQRRAAHAAEIDRLRAPMMMVDGSPELSPEANVAIRAHQTDLALLDERVAVLTAALDGIVKDLAGAQGQLGHLHASRRSAALDCLGERLGPALAALEQAHQHVRDVDAQVEALIAVLMSHGWSEVQVGPDLVRYPWRDAAHQRRADLRRSLDRPRDADRLAELSETLRAEVRALIED